MADLFDMKIRALRRDRAARSGAELFMLERAFEDCFERLELIGRRFERGLLIGCPDASWPERLAPFAATLDIADPGPVFAGRAGSEALVEDAWQPPVNAYELAIAVGTLDTVNALPLALLLIRHAMTANGLFLGAMSGGDTLPQLRSAMRAADVVSGGAAPHVHPRIEPSALAQLLSDAGFVRPVVDVDRAPVAYSSFERLVGDLRGMAATNSLASRPRFVGKAARAAAIRAFASAGDGERTVETFETLHFAAWTSEQG